MNKYESGNYLLTLSIRDKNSGKEIKREVTLTWK